MLPGLLGLSFRKFSWPGRLSLLLLQEDELHKCKRDLLKDFSHHNIIARMTSRVQHSRERSTSALPFRGMHLPPCLSSLFSGDMVRYAHSFEGDGDEWSSLPIRFQILPCPAVLWEFTSSKVSSSISSMSQHPESRESTADHKHVYEVMGRKNLTRPCALLSARSWEDGSSRMLLKASMLVTVTVRLARRVPARWASRSSHSSRGYSPMLVRYQVRGPDPGTERLLS